MNILKQIWFRIIRKNLVSTILLGTAFSGCAKTNAPETPVCAAPACIEIIGKLTQEHVDAVASAPEETESLQINSIGGRSGFAQKIAQEVFDRGLDVIIVNECSSACLEFIAVSAKSVTAFERPLIAVHGSPLTTEILLDQNGLTLKGNCRFPSLKFLHRVYQAKSLNGDFPQETIERLGEATIEYTTNEDGCLASYSQNFERLYWFPTSEELEKYLGLKIDGAICADYSSCPLE